MPDIFSVSRTTLLIESQACLSCQMFSGFFFNGKHLYFPFDQAEVRSVYGLLILQDFYGWRVANPDSS